MNQRSLTLFIVIGFTFILIGTIIMTTDPSESNFKKYSTYKNINGTVYDSIVEDNECTVCINLINNNNINTTIRTSSKYCDSKLNKTCYNIYLLFKTDEGNCAATAFEYELDLYSAINQINNTYKNGDIQSLYYKPGDKINIKGFSESIEQCFIGSNTTSMKTSYFGVILLGIGCLLALSCCFESCCIRGRHSNIMPSRTPNLTPDVTPHSSPIISSQMHSEKTFDGLFNETLILENTNDSYSINMPNKINNLL